jgi:hypothetical protein
MLLMMPLVPVFHGALGWWDEILNLLPLVVGVGLLLYMYFNKRKRRAADSAVRQGDLSEAAEAVPPARPEDPRVP